jgi:hypothetical protein
MKKLYYTQSTILIILLLTVVLFFTSCPGDSPAATVPPLPGDLIITEVGSIFHSDTSAWFEVDNRSTETTELSRYTLRSYSYDGTNFELHTFNLPSLTIQPGAYAIIRGKPYSYLNDGPSLVYISDGAIYPFWTSGGFLELKVDGNTTDFIRFGTSTDSPSSPSEWEGSAAMALPYSNPDEYGISLSRDGSNTDSNTLNDWFLHDFATPGGPNDITSNVDLDLDGIPDECEAIGKTFAGLPLYDWGARLNQKDIFIHIDYMNSTDEGIMPREEALQNVVDAFATSGMTPAFAIHFDVGDLYDQSPGINTVKFDLDDKSHEVPYASSISFADLSGYANYYQYKSSYMDLARKQIFHYLLMANSQEADGSDGSSGIAELIGNDIIISLGNWGLESSTTPYENELINFQAATIMHELGHNLGLEHGGDEAENYKPNYISIMNYLYQLYGLPEIGNKEDDRYQLKGRPASEWNTRYTALINGPLTDTFVLSYSDGSSSNLVETNLNELDGLGRSGTAGADFNFNDNKTDNPLPSTDINFDTINTGLHTDYEDWNNLNLLFMRYYSGDIEGVNINSSIDTFSWIDRAQNDFQPIYYEDKPEKLLQLLQDRKKK